MRSIVVDHANKYGRECIADDNHSFINTLNDIDLVDILVRVEENIVDIIRCIIIRLFFMALKISDKESVIAFAGSVIIKV